MSDTANTTAKPTEVSKWEQRLEGLLWRSRFLVLLAVIPSLLGAVVLFVIGTVDIFQILWQTISYYTLGSDINIHDSVVTDIIIAIDIYLIAIVLMIFGLGVYRLFVSQIEASESEGPSHPFNVKSFDQLKDKIVRVVILAVIIEFFRAVVDIHFNTPLDAIYLALSALALAAALYLMSLAYKTGKE
ncbi:YqhA family protein [Lacimicrobium alkaliphilum]|uniref:Membrane protein n=1 Tax=Lacimicrobium alkaliphilum TaxID=1526571 RepID=A0ABQ1RPW4_9ALTE|nr:YqhA family protein [Lacimicrobium alkaliphilum]GGD75523.1 membrane protein [Lacimicrobium alkaliphilum]